jgi:8-oxo-dGTP diphosphatase
VRRLGPPTEAGHTAIWLPVQDATHLLGNLGDQGAVKRLLSGASKPV